MWSALVSLFVILVKPEFISCTRRNHLLNSRDNLLDTRNNLLNTRHYLQNARNYLITTEGKKHVPSNATHSSAKQATHRPGTTGVRQVPTGGTGNGGGRTMESGIGRFPSLTGTTQSTSSPPPHRNKRQPHHASAVGQPFSPTPACMPSWLPCYLCRQTSWPTVRGCPPLGHLFAQLEAAPTNPSRLPGR